MEEKNILRFELLGNFSCNGKRADRGKAGAAPGKKALSFLQYLIVNHTRNVSSEELIDQFWAVRSSDPANALKNMLFKVRKLLKDLFPEQKNMIVTLQGYYAWNPELRFELDSERFEQACLDAKRRGGEAETELLYRALALYKGDFLSGNDSSWVVSPRRYYQTLYLDACREVLPMLQNQERWTEAAAICEQAQEVDFAADDFVVCQMQALIALGQPGRAVEEYKRFRQLLWQEFQITPSESVERVHNLAAGMCRGAGDNEDVLKLVAEGTEDGKAFFCTFGMFRNIVALEKRHLTRSRGVSTLVIVSLGNKVAPNTDARRLERVLLEGLRAGDPVARLDAVSYILMLTGTSMEKARFVTERIDRAFRKAYSHSRACIFFRMSQLEPDNKFSAENFREITES